MARATMGMSVVLAKMLTMLTSPVAETLGMPMYTSLAVVAVPAVSPALDPSCIKLTHGEPSEWHACV